MGLSIELPELTFLDEGHTYHLDGAMIPSVTEIMRPLSRHEYTGVSEATLIAAADRGTAVHNAIENWIKFGMDDIDPDYRGYLDAFHEFWDRYSPEPEGSEIRTYHKLYRYAGTIDLLARIDGKLAVVDYKTTYRLIDKNVRVQLEAYSQALKSHGIEVEKKIALHLGKDGRWKAPEYPVKDAEALRVFNSLKCLYDYMEQ